MPQRALKRISIAAFAVLAALVASIAGPAQPAHAATVAYDIKAAITKLGTDTSRDFGIDRLFTRITYTSTVSQTVTFQTYDWGAMAWVEFYRSPAEVSGDQTATFDPR
jgi:hypothetical protein